jgi:hypothetical protein
MTIYQTGFLTRAIITLFLLKTQLVSFRLYLPFLLTYLDGIDSNSPGIDTHSFEYKLYDKLGDLVSYLFVSQLFPVEKEFLYLLVFRTIGVLLFGMTRRLEWLVVFPDLMKEYLLYTYLYSDTSAFPVLIPVKMVYEHWHHFIQDRMTT